MFAPLIDEPVVKAEVQFYPQLVTVIGLWLCTDGHFHWATNGQTQTTIVLSGRWPSGYGSIREAMMDMMGASEWACRIVSSKVSGVRTDA